MHLIPPEPGKQKWNIRLRLPDGRTVKVRGHRDREIATRTGQKIMMLVRAKENGDPPPSELRPWIGNMDKRLADRLVALGLVQRHHLARATLIEEWIGSWAEVVSARNPESHEHAPQQRQKVSRLIDAMGATRLDHLDPDLVLEAINGLSTKGRKKPRPLSTATRRSYGVAILDFSRWLSRKIRVENPLADLELPGPTERVVYERQPLTVEEFRRLIAHLDTFERYAHQKFPWTANDRKMIYWTAVKTGYRERELARLRVCDLHLGASPPAVCLRAQDTKNKARGEVPIPSDLASALRKYTEGLEPTNRVFRFPSTSGSVVDMLRRDLEGAGIPWKLPGGEVIDFHALRSTAITWWLDEDGLPQKKVQVLARLKTLALVQTYSRNYRLSGFDWLDRGPKLVEESAVAV